MTNLQQLQDAIHSVASPQAMAWLNESCCLLRKAANPADDLSLLSAMARRKTGHAQLGPDVSAILTAAGQLSIKEWTTGDAARIILILTATEAFPEQAGQLVTSVYRLGDESERAIVTKGLALFPAPDTLKPLALETGRANSTTLFSALALDNPYPAAHYSDHEFNQLVLKALFMGLGIERMVGLQARTNAELSRMCEDYMDERRAASRTIPRDIWLAMSPYASARGKQLILDHLAHEDPGHRYYSLLALKTNPIDQSVLDLLRQRIALETDPGIIKLLQGTLAAS